MSVRLSVHHTGLPSQALLSFLVASHTRVRVRPKGRRRGGGKGNARFGRGMRAPASPLTDGASQNNNKRYNRTDYTMKSSKQNRAIL